MWRRRIIGAARAQRPRGLGGEIAGHQGCGKRIGCMIEF